MKCIMCDNTKVLKAETIATYKYKESGLENVILHGVKKFACDKCGEEYYDFGDVEQLHSLIASILIQKSSTLTGREIRFLRKHLGYSAATLAGIVGYENEHLSRIENGKNPVQEVFDRVIRFMVKEKFPNRNYQMQDLFLEGKLLAIEWVELSLKNKSWEAKAA